MGQAQALKMEMEITMNMVSVLQLGRMGKEKHFMHLIKCTFSLAPHFYSFKIVHLLTDY